MDDLEVLNVAEPLPFVVTAHEEKQQKTNEELRLRYRYLDLRRPTVQQQIITRNWSTGVYTYRLRDGDETYEGKLVIAR